MPPSQAVRSPIFWIMYLMFFLVAAGGLMSAAQLAPIAKERGIADATVVIFGISTPAIVAALTFHNITNGVGRPLNGWISDHIGRANMMGIAFGIEAICIAAFGFFGTTPMSFIITDALVFLFWGDIFSLFAATVGDAFGRKFVTVNYGIMYTAKGVASLLVPLGNVLTHMTGQLARGLRSRLRHERGRGAARLLRPEADHQGAARTSAPADRRRECPPASRKSWPRGAPRGHDTVIAAPWRRGIVTCRKGGTPVPTDLPTRTRASVMSELELVALFSILPWLASLLLAQAYPEIANGLVLLGQLS